MGKKDKDKTLVKKKDKTLKKLWKLRDKYFDPDSDEKYQVKLKNLLSKYEGNHLSLEYNGLRPSQIKSNALKKFKKRVKKIKLKLKKHYKTKKCSKEESSEKSLSLSQDSEPSNKQ